MYKSRVFHLHWKEKICQSKKAKKGLDNIQPLFDGNHLFRKNVVTNFDCNLF